MIRAVKGDRAQTLLRLSRQAFAQYRWSIFWLSALSFAGILMEGIGVNALIPLFTFVLGEGNADDVISKTIEGFFGYVGVPFSITTLLIFIGFLFVMRAAISVVLTYVQVKITSDYERRTRETIFEKVLGAKWEYYLKQRAGHLETLLLIDIKHSSLLLSNISSIITKVLGLLIYVFIAINISVLVSLVTLLIGAVLMLVLKPWFFKVKKLAHKRTVLNREVSHHVNENITGMKTVKSLGATGSVMEKSRVQFTDFWNVTVKATVLKSLSTSIMEPIGVIYLLIIFGLSINNPEFGLPQLVPIVYLIQRIFIHIDQLQRSVHSINDSLPHLKSILDYDSAVTENQEVSSGTEKFSFNNTLSFSDVSYKYPGGKQILHNLSFEVSQGEMVGLMGPSGSGKTTIVDLVLQLLQPKEGVITVDGVDVKSISLEEWRNNVGYVSQDMFLINDTIENNIKFFDSQISDAEMIESAKMANIYEFIKQSKDGFKTHVGERGLLLSVGQRQRIALARVLARKTKIIILDEATSALDYESEIEIEKAITKLKGKVTFIIVAHRLSTIKKADRLIILDKGSIIEEGSTSELLKKEGSYFAKINKI